MIFSYYFLNIIIGIVNIKGVNMKEFIINKSMNYIQKNTDYNETKLKEIRYGLVSIYLTISKMIVIFFIAYILGIFKEMILYTIIYNIIRIPSFGIHATKSWICLISSILIFIGIPYISLNITIPVVIKIIICIICIILMFKNSPADTKKRPIINKFRRQIYKTVSTILVIVYSFLSIIYNNNFISNCLIFSMIIQNFMISPTVYKLFNLPYNNYITYLKDHPDKAN